MFSKSQWVLIYNSYTELILSVNIAYVLYWKFLRHNAKTVF